MIVIDFMLIIDIILSMKKNIILLIIFGILIAGCSSPESRYAKAVKPVIDQFSREMDKISQIYSNSGITMTKKDDFDIVQEDLYNIKIKLLSINTPADEIYVNYTDLFLKTIEEFELLNYKASNLHSLMAEKQQRENESIDKKYSLKHKNMEKDLKVLDNLMEIQKNDYQKTLENCREYLVKLKKQSKSMFEKDIKFPEI